MKRLPALALAALLLTGCSKTASPNIRYWSTYNTDGDKPGIGFVLTEDNGAIVAGRFYILDPNHPGDFSSGFGINFDHLQPTGTGATFALSLPDNSVQKCELVFHASDLSIGKLHAVMRDPAASNSRDIPFDFAPTPNPPSPGLTRAQLEEKDRQAAAR